MQRFYGQYEPPVDRFIFERYFPDPDIRGTFVECGAFDGLLECSCKFFEESMGWSGYNLEPVPWLFEELCRNRPDSRNLEIGLSDASRIVSFKHAISPILGRNFGNGSVRHAPAHLEALIESGCTFEDIEVHVTTWRDFVAEEEIRHVDLFVLDVEGLELAVIEGMHGCDVIPDVMCVEFGHIGLGPVRDALRPLGLVYDITSHGNAFFVREAVLGLFALRSARRAADTDARPAPGPSATDHALVVEERDRLRAHVEELSELYRSIVNSKGWRFVERLRAIRSFGRTR